MSDGRMQPTPVFQREGTFQFLDVPAGQFFNKASMKLLSTFERIEMRNLVYHFALEHVRTCIIGHPPVSSISDQSTAQPPKLPAPYLSLTQSCAELRSEFRPLWLDANVVEPQYAPMYFNIIPSFGSLTLQFYQSGCLEVDFLSFFTKSTRRETGHRHHGPFHEPMLNANLSTPWVAALVQILKNCNPRWLRHIAGSGFKGVHFKLVYEVSYETFPPEHRYILYLHIGVRDNAFYISLCTPDYAGERR
jgi:hypothetical protein